MGLVPKQGHAGGTRQPRGKKEFLRSLFPGNWTSCGERERERRKKREIEKEGTLNHSREDFAYILPTTASNGYRSVLYASGSCTFSPGAGKVQAVKTLLFLSW